MKKAIIIIMCIIFCFVSVISTVIALDSFHLEHCHEQNCCKCILIHSSINFMKNLNWMIVYIGLINFIVPIIYIFKKIKSKNILVTLIDCKVQFNE